MPYVEKFESDMGDDMVPQWKDRLLRMDHIEIEYSGKLEIASNGHQWSIEINEPREHSNRMLREYGSWRIFKLRIPDTDKMDTSFLRNFFHLPAKERTLPFANNQFHG